MLWSRPGGYDRQRFESFLYNSREFTEHWAHEASVVRVSDWPLLEYRRKAWRPWKRNPLETLDSPDDYLRCILEQVTGDGAVTANDLPAAANPKRGKPGDWHRPIQQRFASQPDCRFPLRKMVGRIRRMSRFLRHRPCLSCE